MLVTFLARFRKPAPAPAVDPANLWSIEGLHKRFTTLGGAAEHAFTFAEKMGVCFLICGRIGGKYARFRVYPDRRVERVI